MACLVLSISPDGSIRCGAVNSWMYTSRSGAASTSALAAPEWSAWTCESTRFERSAGRTPLASSPARMASALAAVPASTSVGASPSKRYTDVTLGPNISTSMP
jgi:hypothetical protein